MVSDRKWNEEARNRITSQRTIESSTSNAQSKATIHPHRMTCDWLYNYVYFSNYSRRNQKFLCFSRIFESWCIIPLPSGCEHVELEQGFHLVPWSSADCWYLPRYSSKCDKKWSPANSSNGPSLKTAWSIEVGPVPIIIICGDECLIKLWNVNREKTVISFRLQYDEGVNIKNKGTPINEEEDSKI